MTSHCTNIQLLTDFTGCSHNQHVGVFFEYVFVCSTVISSCAGFCSGCYRSHWGSLLNSLILIGWYGFCSCLCALRFGSHCDWLQKLFSLVICPTWAQFLLLHFITPCLLKVLLFLKLSFVFPALWPIFVWSWYLNQTLNLNITLSFQSSNWNWICMRFVKVPW